MAEQTRRERVAAFALVAALVLAISLGGFAYAASGTAQLAGENDEAEPADSWTSLNVEIGGYGDLLVAGSFLTQTVKVANNDVLAGEGDEETVGVSENAYVRVHVAVPSEVNDFDGGSSDDILQSSLENLSVGNAASGSSWVLDGSYKTNIHNLPCTVRVFVYSDVLAPGETTSALSETFTVNPRCDVRTNGSAVMYIKDGAQFACDGFVPVYVCSEAVQADAWEPVGTTDYEKAASVLNAAFGAIDYSYTCSLTWANPVTQAILASQN